MSRRDNDIRRAARLNGFSPKAAEAMTKYRAGSAASDAWLDAYRAHIQRVEEADQRDLNPQAFEVQS